MLWPSIPSRRYRESSAGSVQAPLQGLVENTAQYRVISAPEACTGPAAEVCLEQEQAQVRRDQWLKDRGLWDDEVITKRKSEPIDWSLEAAGEFYLVIGSIAGWIVYCAGVHYAYWQGPW